MRRWFISISRALLPPLVAACAVLTSCSESSVVETPLDRVIIVDQDARQWDITQAVYRYGFDPDRFLFGLGAFVVRPLIEPPVVASGDSAYPGPAETFAVVGVAVAAVPRAYRITDIQSSEVVDDVIAGVPLAVFHSPLVNMTEVYGRVADTDTLTLSASGWVYEQRSVLFDYETGSMWYPIPGTGVLTCISGLLFEGTLPSRGFVATGWNTWRAMNPATGFMVTPVAPAP